MNSQSKIKRVSQILSITNIWIKIDNKYKHKYRSLLYKIKSIKRLAISGNLTVKLKVHWGHGLHNWLPGSTVLWYGGSSLFPVFHGFNLGVALESGLVREHVLEELVLRGLEVSSRRAEFPFPSPHIYIVIESARVQGLGGNDPRFLPTFLS